MARSVDDVRDIIKNVIETDIKNAKTTFDKLDSKGTKDGFITAEDMGDRAIQGLAKKYDTNGDGKISRDEYMAITLNRALEKKLSFRDADAEGIIGHFEVGDFKRLLELNSKIGATVDVKPVDNDTIATILLKMKSGEHVVPYSLFKRNLVDMYNDSKSYVGEVKELLLLCKTHLGASDAECEEWTGLDKGKFVEDADYLEMRKCEPAKDILGEKCDILDSDVIKSRTMGARMDRQFEKATGTSSHENVTFELMKSFLAGSGVNATDSALQNTFNLMVSVSYPDVSRGLVKFVQNKLF